jgi:hypothetical protein
MTESWLSLSGEKKRAIGGHLRIKGLMLEKSRIADQLRFLQKQRQMK